LFDCLFIVHKHLEVTSQHPVFIPAAGLHPHATMNKGM